MKLLYVIVFVSVAYVALAYRAKSYEPCNPYSMSFKVCKKDRP